MPRNLTCLVDPVHRIIMLALFLPSGVFRRLFRRKIETIAVQTVFVATVAGAVASSSNAAAVRPLLENQPGITEIVREAEARPSRSGPAPSNTGSMIFAGRIFRALGEVECPNVRRAVDELGGRMSADQDEDVDFITVRLVR